MPNATPSLPGVLSRPDAQVIVDALNTRLGVVERQTAGGSEVFLKLAVAGDHKINRGRAEVEFAGGSPLSGEVVIAHGLESDEVFPTVASSNPAIHIAAVSSSKTTITFRGEHVQGISPAAGTKIIFSWVAMT